MDPSYPAFPIFALLGFILVLIPLPWHLHAWNSGTCLFMIWVAIACLNQFINSIIWHNNAIDWAPIWCDISTRLTVGISVGIPAASLCINRRLYKIATCRTATITHAQKRRAVLVDLAIGLGLPALQMPLQFIVQGHRYDIWEDIGCYPTTVNTPAAYPLSFIWPNVISLASAVYCVLTLRAFMLRRAQFSQFLSSTTSLSINRYFRLMALATSEILFTVPFSTYGLYLNIIEAPIYPWKSWADIHFMWYTIDTFPAILWRSNPTSLIVHESTRWSLIFCAFVFFGFFGFAEESRKNYRCAYRAIVARFGVTRSNPSSQDPTKCKAIVYPMKSTSGTLPLFVSQNSRIPTVDRDSYHSSNSHKTNSTDTLCASSKIADSNTKAFIPSNQFRLSRSTI
ncbi:STE3-domain-containing protein [Phlegmacium glaucopus]|nr:STE3-domain-containing protein [Phlegmacium glaucopus]